MSSSSTHITGIVVTIIIVVIIIIIVIVGGGDEGLIIINARFSVGLIFIDVTLFLSVLSS
jgi:hypothetical protein